jgi:hypothetical protein
MLKYFSLVLLLVSSVAAAGSANPYSQNSEKNPYGQLNNPYSDVNNPYGTYRNPYSPNSNDNPYGQGNLIVPQTDNSLELYE